MSSLNEILIRSSLLGLFESVGSFKNTGRWSVKSCNNIPDLNIHNLLIQIWSSSDGCCPSMSGNLVGLVMQGKKEKEWSRLTKSLFAWDSFKILMFKSPSKMQFLSFKAGLLRIEVNVVEVD